MPLTKSQIQDKIKLIDSETVFNASKLNLRKAFTDLNANFSHQKWRAYLYLEQCVEKYRDGDTQDLLDILAFLFHSNRNKKWLAGLLLDPSTKEDGDKWGSGKHEWLERSLIVDVLKRSAGMTEEDPFCQNEHVGYLDWLLLQASFRSPTKWLLFRNDAHSITSGHCGSVKKELNGRGFSTDKSHAFHEKLENAFYESKTIHEFSAKSHNILTTDCYSGKSKISSHTATGYVVDGSPTNNSPIIARFGYFKLKNGVKAAQEQMKTMNLSTSTHNNVALPPIDLHEFSSDSDSDETIQANIGGGAAPGA